MSAFSETSRWQVLLILLCPPHSYVAGDMSFIGRKYIISRKSKHVHSSQR
jgi:hypothetical protein